MACLKYSGIMKEVSMAVAAMLIFSGCNHLPPPPVAMEPGATDSVMLNYATAENGYAAAYYKLHDDLLQEIKTELLQREENSLPACAADLNSCLGPDGQEKLYVTKDKEVRLHRNSQDEDELVFVEQDPAFQVRVYLSSSGKYFFIESFSDETTECRFLPTDLKNLKPVLFLERTTGHWYTADHFGGMFFWILSNQFAPTRKLFVTPVNLPGAKGWNTVIMPNDTIFIEGYSVLDQKYLALIQRKNQSVALQITDIVPPKKTTDKVENKISFKEPEGRITNITYEKKEKRIIFHYSSMKSPLTCFSYGIDSKRLSIRWRKQIKGYDPDNYKAEVLWVPQKNGSPVAVSVMHRIDLAKPDGQNPLLLIPFLSGFPGDREGFNPSMISLLDRGFYIAYAHIGMEMDSEQLKYTTEIIDIAEFLVKMGITLKGQITLMGMKTGATLALAAAAENPDIFKAVVAEYPVCEEDSKFQKIPALLILSGLQKGQKADFGVIKKVAKMRKNKADCNILLIQTELNPVKEEDILRVAQKWTFIHSCYGLGGSLRTYGI